MYSDGRDRPDPSKILGVFGLSQATEKADLEDIFTKYGKIEHLDMILDRQSGTSRGFGFIYFESVEDATRAKKACNGMMVDGRKIRVDYSITKRPHKAGGRRGDSHDRDDDDRY